MMFPIIVAFTVAYQPPSLGCRPVPIGPITLVMKRAGTRSAGNPHATCDEAGVGNGASELSGSRRASSRPYRLCATSSTLRFTSKQYFHSDLPDAGRTCTGDHPKGSAKEVARGVSELGMVKGVEKLAAELERLGFRQP